MEIEETSKLVCDNKSTSSISPDLVQHDRMKHVDIYGHFIEETLEANAVHGGGGSSYLEG